eukprot:5559999-Amphidinium_carterae.1
MCAYPRGHNGSVQGQPKCVGVFDFARLFRCMELKVTDGKPLCTSHIVKDVEDEFPLSASTLCRSALQDGMDLLTRMTQVAVGSGLRWALLMAD